MPNFFKEEGNLTSPQPIFVQQDAMTTISESQLRYLLEAAEEQEGFENGSFHAEILFFFLAFAIESGFVLFLEHGALSTVASYFLVGLTFLGVGIAVYSGINIWKERKRKEKFKNRHSAKIKEIMIIFEKRNS